MDIKKEKRDNEWVTMMARSLKIEYTGETPQHVYIGFVRYSVGEYTPEAV